MLVDSMFLNSVYTKKLVVIDRHTHKHRQNQCIVTLQHMRRWLMIDACIPIMSCTMLPTYCFWLVIYSLILVLITINLRFQFMLKCWERLPETRPTFSFIVRSLSKVLDGMAGYMDIDSLKGIQNIITDDSGNTSIGNEPINKMW